MRVTVQPELAGVSFAARLARFGDSTAIRTKNQSVSYRELARRVEDMIRAFGPARRLIALEAENSVPSLVAYLAAMSSGHPLLILPTGGGTAAEMLVAAYDPD